MIHYHKKRLYTEIFAKLLCTKEQLSQLTGFPHLYMHLWVRIHVVKQLLVVDVLLIPLQGHVVAEVISQRDKEDFAAVQFGLFSVLIQKQVCSN